MKRGDITGGWRTLCSGEVHNLYSSTNIIIIIIMIKVRVIKW
jgi:hypothetical protein